VEEPVTGAGLNVETHLALPNLRPSSRNSFS
jgi:hypothetical protein